MPCMSRMLLQKYSAIATLDPRAVSGAVSMALFEELVDTVSVVGQRTGLAAPQRSFSARPERRP